ncbi:hypothetical protein [Haemophilus influenzae]|uniref:hypothetical protein n=1 Tax=Haemophilus influenzae TaxID=727 RepID=UPI000E3445F2|nr:hypothetical protein [Haemophilus influenzae]RFO74421.1 hypothetical protein CH565_03660 [Haemophilus influenzae]RFO79588.1 hypothetical protein CH566_00045 [Haemophilus influenzae]
MNKIFVILTALILSGCATKLTQLNVPTQLEYNGKHYVLTGSQDFETIARYVYIAKPDTLENWQSEIEILFDRNQSERSIKERIALRERIYRNTGVKDFHFDAIPKNSTNPNELNGYVIYSPTKENPSWQVNVMKGRQLSQCGFVQFQYSQKIQQPTRSKHLSVNKVQRHLQKYIVDIERKYLQNLKWQLFCEK